MAREANDATTSGRWAKKRALIHERAVRHNPNSYKLWFFYLRERRWTTFEDFGAMTSSTNG